MTFEKKSQRFLEVNPPEISSEPSPITSSSPSFPVQFSPSVESSNAQKPKESPTKPEEPKVSNTKESQKPKETNKPKERNEPEETISEFSEDYSDFQPPTKGD